MKYKRIPLWLPAVFACLLLVPAAGAQSTTRQQIERYAVAGQNAMREGNYAVAQQNFEKLIQLDPGIAEVHAMLAVIDFKQHEFSKTIHEIEIAKRLKPSLPRLGSLLGIALSEEGRYSEAIPHLKKAFHDSKDRAIKKMCGLELMRSYSNLNRDPDAVQVAVAMNHLFPNDPEVLYHTGRVYGNRAYEVMEKLHNIAPGSVWMLQAQGEANQSRKDWPAAIVAYKHVLVLDPSRPGIHYQLGRIYLSMYRASGSAKDMASAMQEFHAELKVDPSNADASYELANIQQESGNLTAAGLQYQAVLKQAPDFEQALVGLGGIYLSNRKPTKAIPLLERATRIQPDDVVAWWRLSQAYRAVGNRKGQMHALDEFKKLHSGAASKMLNPPSRDAVTPQKLNEPTGH